MSDDIIKRLRVAIAEHPLSPIHGYAADIAALIDRLEAAERENERLREDAERYRWLRGDACPDHSVRWTQWEVRCWVAPFWSGDLRRDGLDRSIDAAMAAERGKE